MNLKVSIIQSDLHWESIGANLAMFEEKIWQIDEKTDLIVLPEMFNTGFSMNSETLSEPMNSKTFRWMKQQASQTGAVVVGSYIVREGTSYYNRLIWMQPNGEFSYYDKRHLFRMADEHLHFSSGKTILVKEIQDWRVSPLICYDLRFPAWSRNIINKQFKYDVLVYVANWPTRRVGAWTKLLQARAIENLCYVIGVNRIGADGNGIVYNGQSAVIDPFGEYIFKAEDEEVIETSTLDLEALKTFREKFPANIDADDFEITI